MKKLTCVLFVLSFLMTLAAGATLGHAGQVYIHFIVVPSQTQDGTSLDKSLEDFRQMLAQTAGGYTYLGTGDGGTLLSGGQIEKGVNASFIVSAPKNLTEEIEAWVPRHFGNEKPFILVWKGESNY